jgi:hypothetical protein
MSSAESVEQGIGLPAIGNLPTGQAQGDGAALGVNERVDLAGQAAAGTSQAGIVSTRFFCRRCLP